MQKLLRIGFFYAVYKVSDGFCQKELKNSLEMKEFLRLLKAYFILLSVHLYLRNQPFDEIHGLYALI